MRHCLLRVESAVALTMGLFVSYNPGKSGTALFFFILKSEIKILAAYSPYWM